MTVYISEIWSLSTTVNLIVDQMKARRCRCQQFARIRITVGDQVETFQLRDNASLPNRRSDLVRAMKLHEAARAQVEKERDPATDADAFLALLDLDIAPVDDFCRDWDENLDSVSRAFVDVDTSDVSDFRLDDLD
jgi:hypothetical protein